MANYRSWQADMQGFFRDLLRTHGDIVAFSLGAQPCVLVHGAGHVRDLFHSHGPHLRKPAFLKESNRGHWGDGLTTLEGACWKQRRHLLREVFTSSRPHTTSRHVMECATEMLDGWQQQALRDTSEPLIRDLAMDLRILAGRIAVRVIIDADLSACACAEGRSGLIPMAEVYGETFTTSPGYDPAAPVFLRRPRAPRRMPATLAIIEDRLRSGEDRGDLLSAILGASRRRGTPLTKAELIGEVIQMLYAGHLTIPMALINLFHDLASSPFGELIREESSRLCDGTLPTQEAIRRSLCMAVMRESLRLHPPAPILYREVDSPFTLAGHRFPLGWAVWISPHLLHRDPRYFPDPERFLPERFRSAEGAAMASSVYMPFGTGPRTCIAHAMALEQMTLVALLTLRRFRIRAAVESPGFRLEPRYNAA